MFSNLIIGLVELVHKEEMIGMQENKCGVYILKNTHEEGHAYHLILKKKFA